MAAIPSSARPSPVPAFQKGLAFVDVQTGIPTQIAQQYQERLRNYVLGSGRIIPCSATAVSNLITLQPNEAAPSIEGYIFGDCYPFWAPATSDGVVTATLVPKTGTLATLKVYKAAGAAQAVANDLIVNHLYWPVYLPIADSSAGGLVLLGASEPEVGSFTMANAATKVIADTRVTASSKILYIASNASGIALQASVAGLYTSALSAGVSFTAATGNAAAAAGTETYDYVIVG